MSFDQSLLNQPIDGIFANGNMNATTGFSMREGTKVFRLVLGQRDA